LRKEGGREGGMGGGRRRFIFLTQKRLADVEE
jgi:hypothetical protein